MHIKTTTLIYIKSYMFPEKYYRTLSVEYEIKCYSLIKNIHIQWLERKYFAIHIFVNKPKQLSPASLGNNAARNQHGGRPVRVNHANNSITTYFKDIHFLQSTIMILLKEILFSLLQKKPFLFHSLHHHHL